MRNAGRGNQKQPDCRTTVLLLFPIGKALMIGPTGDEHVVVQDAARGASGDLLDYQSLLQDKVDQLRLENRSALCRA